MGSKISGKMAAAGRVVQVVRPHAPLIKFPNRKGIPKPNVDYVENEIFPMSTQCFSGMLLIQESPLYTQVEEVLKMVAANPQQTSPSSSSLPPIASPPRPPGPVSRIPGTPDSLAAVRDLPQRYRRRTLALEEMDFIQRGGPE